MSFKESTVKNGWTNFEKDKDLLQIWLHYTKKVLNEFTEFKLLKLCCSLFGKMAKVLGPWNGGLQELSAGQ